jgi:hypothetical protein
MYNIYDKNNSITKTKENPTITRVRFNSRVISFFETGDENALNQFQSKQEEFAEAVKDCLNDNPEFFEFVKDKDFTLNDFPLQKSLKSTENPLRKSIRDKNKRIGKIILDTETGQRKIIYDE